MIELREFISNSRWFLAISAFIRSRTSLKRLLLIRTPRPTATSVGILASAAVKSWVSVMPHHNFQVHNQHPLQSGVLVYLGFEKVNLQYVPL